MKETATHSQFRPPASVVFGFLLVLSVLGGGVYAFLVYLK